MSPLFLVLLLVCTIAYASFVAQHHHHSNEFDSNAEYTGKWMVRLRAPLTEPERASLRTAGLRGISESPIRLRGGLEVGTLAELDMQRTTTDSVDAASLVHQLIPPVKVENIARDVKVYASSIGSVPWNLDRLDRRALDLDGVYAPIYNGAGTRVYVVDTGINASLSEFFGNRVKLVFSAFPQTTATDCNGHGTHVAGSLGALHYGVASAVNLYSVRVLDCNGVGSTTTLAAGLLWILQNGVPPAVINFSLGYYGSNSVINELIAELIQAGYTITAAAGNEGLDSCLHYPSALPNVLSVGSTNIVDVVSSFSNYGKCVDIFAPGESIRSLQASDASERVLSGTSMASAHVAGASALYLQSHPNAKSHELATYLLNYATFSVLSNTRGAPNRMLYVGGEPDDWNGDTDHGQVDEEVPIDYSNSVVFGVSIWFVSLSILLLSCT